MHYINPFSLLLLLAVFVLLPNQVKAQNKKGYVLELEKDIARIDSIHFGEGVATGYSFFENLDGFKYVFRKRVLHKGAAIRYHLQEKDEIYYILKGIGEMKMNDETFEVQTGFAILTRAGSWHGLSQTGDQDLELIIVYEKH